jgi:hypothetical protein
MEFAGKDGVCWEGWSLLGRIEFARKDGIYVIAKLSFD